jgi:hypothetical protein
LNSTNDEEKEGGSLGRVLEHPQVARRGGITKTERRAKGTRK